ncbi:hypothetical protein CROQUDRAFT_17404, partial [Cronartium quercuum f. sp. fusiforme G11]
SWQCDNPFWSDGLFTNHNALWAMDPLTQNGMRELSYNQRAQEELSRIGWEFRRQMRWLVHSNKHLSHHLETL